MLKLALALFLTTIELREVHTHIDSCYGGFTAEICKYLCKKLPVLPEQCKHCVECPPHTQDYCSFNGTLYPVGEFFYSDPNRPCVYYRCDESLQVVEVDRVECSPAPAPDCTPIFTDRVCCPQWDCPDDTIVCQFNGTNYTLGDTFYDDLERPCVLYECTETGVSVANLTVCPPPPHDSCSPWFQSGVCCPLWDCVSGSCVYNGVQYDHGVVWAEDPVRPCLLYACNNSQVYEYSRHETCPAPPASHCVSRHVQGQCCASYDCRNVTCLYRGVAYPLGAIFNDDDENVCKKYNCTVEGPVKIEDLSLLCPPLNPPNCTQIRKPGECCKECDTTSTVEECKDSQGNVHEDGTVFFYDQDGCILVECSNGTIELVMNRSDNCASPPFNPNCTIDPDSTDKCCPQYVCPCVYRGQELTVGEKAWEDPLRQCRRVMCMPDGSVVTIVDLLPCPQFPSGCVPLYESPQCCHIKYTCMYDPQHNIIPMT